MPAKSVHQNGLAMVNGNSKSNLPKMKQSADLTGSEAVPSLATRIFRVFSLLVYFWTSSLM